MIPIKVKKAVLLRDKVCVDCGGYGDWRHYITYSHIKHRKMGGNPKMDTTDNIQIRCAYCHDVFDGRIKEAK